MHHDITRALIEIAGEHRISFLQGLLTQDIQRLRPDHALYAALLSPQGKLQHDGFLLAHGEAILLDVDASQKDALLKKLTLYKLRAAVTLRDVSAQWRVSYRVPVVPALAGHCTAHPRMLVVTDPRMADMGERLYVQDAGLQLPDTLPHAEYHAHRLALGIPDSVDMRDEVGMDAGLDLLGAISFTKGCYVGQEVTARMHYKSIARKGFYRVQSASASPLPAAGGTLMAGDAPLGTLRGAYGVAGLALLRFDAAEAALNSKTALTVDNLPVTIHSPAWLQPKLAQFRAAGEAQ